MKSGPRVEVMLEPRDVLLEVELTGENTLQRYDIEMLSKAGQGHPHPECTIEPDNVWCPACRWGGKGPGQGNRNVHTGEGNCPWGKGEVMVEEGEKEREEESL